MQNYVIEDISRPKLTEKRLKNSRAEYIRARTITRARHFVIKHKEFVNFYCEIGIQYLVKELDKTSIKLDVYDTRWDDDLFVFGGLTFWNICGLVNWKVKEHKVEW